MTLVALDGTPLMAVGAANRQGIPGTTTLAASLLDAANEAVVMVGRIYTDDGGSHTIDTSGSSSLQWRSGAVTFANAGTTVKVGLAAVDTTTGPAVRAVNASDVITLDVSKSMAGGGGGVTANAWQTHVPDAGSKTIANGDLVAFCIQMTARGGADLVNVSTISELLTAVRPSVTGFLNTVYANQARQPNAIIVFSDGTIGSFWGGFVASVGNTNQAWNNASGTKEYGNLLQFPFPAKVYGITANVAISGDCDLVLYSDPLGTPVAERSVSIDLNAVAAAGTGPITELFSTPFSLSANVPYAAIIKPTSGTNVSAGYLTLNDAAHQKAWNNGANGYAVNRASGAFASQNSNKDRFGIGLLVGAFDAGGGGHVATRQQLGM